MQETLCERQKEQFVGLNLLDGKFVIFISLFLFSFNVLVRSVAESKQFQHFIIQWSDIGFNCMVSVKWFVESFQFHWKSNCSDNDWKTATSNINHISLESCQNSQATNKNAIANRFPLKKKNVLKFESAPAPRSNGNYLCFLNFTHMLPARIPLDGNRRTKLMFFATNYLSQPIQNWIIPTFDAELKNNENPYFR